MKIDEFINQNRDAFDHELPPAGHLKRFEAKLNKKGNSIRRLIWTTRTIAAASILAFIFLLNMQQPPKEQTQVVALSTEYLEAEKYYKGNIEEKLSELKNRSCETDIVHEERILNDLLDIDRNYEVLRKELIRNGNEERIMEAMINCFRIKEDFLNQVLSQIKKNC